MTSAGRRQTTALILSFVFHAAALALLALAAVQLRATAPIPAPVFSVRVIAQAPARMPSPRTPAQSIVKPAHAVKQDFISTSLHAALRMSTSGREERYFPASALDETPQILNDFRADLKAILFALTQSAVIRLLLNENGGLDAVMLDKGDGVAKAIDLTPQMQELQFLPGKLSGHAVKSELKLSVNGNEITVIE